MYDGTIYCWKVQLSTSLISSMCTGDEALSGTVVQLHPIEDVLRVAWWQHETRHSLARD